MSRQPLPELIVEPWPSGGWAVRITGHPVPISRHDTEEEAVARAAAYRQGLTNELLGNVHANGPRSSDVHEP